MRVKQLLKKNFKSPQLFNKNFKTFSSIETLFDAKKVQEYHEKGYAVIPKVFDTKLIDELQAEIDKIIQNTNQQEIKSIFDARHFTTDQYFLDSGDRVYFFKYR
jgi:hypothetical protein